MTLAAQAPQKIWLNTFPPPVLPVADPPEDPHGTALKTQGHSNLLRVISAGVRHISEGRTTCPISETSDIAPAARIGMAHHGHLEPPLFHHPRFVFKEKMRRKTTVQGIIIHIRSFSQKKLPSVVSPHFAYLNF